MSSEIKSSFKLQRIKLFAKLNLLQAVPHNVRNCCSEPLSESEIELLDSCFSGVHKLEVVEKSSIYCISGFIAYKENIYHDESDPAVNDCPESEFTEIVSRGSLRHPPLELFDLGLFLFNYYKSLLDKSCITKIMKVFRIIYEFTQCSFENSDSTLRRFVNTFSKGYVKSSTENIRIEKGNMIKRRRINN